MIMHLTILFKHAANLTRAADLDAVTGLLDMKVIKFLGFSVTMDFKSFVSNSKNDLVSNSRFSSSTCLAMSTLWHFQVPEQRLRSCAVSVKPDSTRTPLSNNSMVTPEVECPWMFSPIGMTMLSSKETGLQQGILMLCHSTLIARVRFDVDQSLRLRGLLERIRQTRSFNAARAKNSRNSGNTMQEEQVCSSFLSIGAARLPPSAHILHFFWTDGAGLMTSEDCRTWHL